MLNSVPAITFDAAIDLAALKALGGELQLCEDEQLVELEWRLKQHDYFYMMSDDQRYWRRGHDNIHRVHQIVKQFVGTDLEHKAKDMYKQYHDRYGLK